MSQTTGRHSARSTIRSRIGLPSNVQGIALLVAGCALVLIVLVAGVDVAVSLGRIHPGVRVGDVAVGSMTPVAARDVLSRTFDRRSGDPVTLRDGDRSWRITPASAGVRLDATRSVAAAMAVGRTGGFGAAVAARARALFGTMTVHPVVSTTGGTFAGILTSVSDEVATPAMDATVAVEHGAFQLVRSKPGRSMDVAETRRALLDAFMGAPTVVDIAIVTVGPSITDDEAAAALDAAERLASGDVRIVFEERSHAVGSGTVAGWVAFEATPSAKPVTLVATFEPTRIASSVASFTHGIGKPAVDARFVADSGRVTIMPSKTGVGPDFVALSADLTDACLSGERRSATLRLAVTQPELTTREAERMGITDRISVFTTTYSSSNRARVNNVHTLAKALDGCLIPPDGVFSFNQTAGERTAAKGYQEAPAIVDGKLVPQLGGGVCQVGTTVFNAAFFGGLPVVERRNHSYFISHYPKGRDATVSWGGPDLKFRNDTGHWVLLRTAVTSTSLTVALYGTDPGYDVGYTTSGFTNVVPHRVDEIEDPKLARGKRKVEDGGVDGGRITVVRTVTKAGQVVRKDTFVSHYRPKTEVVRIGTKASTATGTVTPTRH